MNYVNRVLIGIFLSTLTFGIGLQGSTKAEPVSSGASENSLPLANPGKHNRPSIRLPRNKHIPIAKFLAREHFQSKLSKELGAELKSFELMTFREYINKYSPGTEVSEIADDRVIAVLQISYPKRFIAYNGVEYFSAISMSVRDGLTGDLIEYEITGQLANPEIFKDRIIEP
jgi:hypothetical protein